MVTLAPDVAAAFPDAEAVNEALRLLLKAAKKTSRTKARSGEKLHKKCEPATSTRIWPLRSASKYLSPGIPGCYLLGTIVSLST